VTPGAEDQHVAAQRRLRAELRPRVTPGAEDQHVAAQRRLRAELRPRVTPGAEDQHVAAQRRLRAELRPRVTPGAEDQHVAAQLVDMSSQATTAAAGGPRLLSVLDSYWADYTRDRFAPGFVGCQKLSAVR
jgi:hypothetical protein